MLFLISEIFENEVVGQLERRAPSLASARRILGHAWRPLGFIEISL